MKIYVILVIACLWVVTAQYCRDQFSNCASLTINGRLCIFPAFKRFCPKSCGICGGPQTTKSPTRIPTTQTPPTRKPTIWKSTTKRPTPSGFCGKLSHASGRVIAGETAQKGAWPWQVLLKSNGRPGCGGSLISPDWVVTAAHCVTLGHYNGGRFTVVLGEHNRNTFEGSEQVIQASKVISHPNWNMQTLENDIALIKLKNPAKYNKYVYPICLPEDHVPVGYKCFITGWGKTSSFGQMHHVLQQAPMKVIGKKECINKNYPSIKVMVTDSMICGGGSGQISGCQGDSGGPFACEFNGRWELHGAVSYGSRYCRSSETYTVFARVAEFRGWIKTETGV